ncbi:MAG: carbon storage regulator [Isosphaerales bacterium]
MLVLSRRQSQQIVIGRDIRITVVKVERDQVRIGIDAPKGVIVLREELVGRQSENAGRAQAQADRPRVQSV